MTIANALDLVFLPNQLIYSNATNQVTGLATAANGVLVTSAGSAPSISSTLPIAVQNNITNLGTIASIGAPLGGAFGGTGVNNGARLITVAGNLTTVGAFAATFTFTGATGVTFPTSGTLATVAGTVSSVVGTLNQIDVVTVGTTATVSIDPAYVGQTSITTLGTVSTGVWSATNIALNKGGTNASLVASNGGIFYSTATAGAILAGTATANQVLLSGSSTAPVWSTATYPVSTTINQILYSSSANVIAGLATGNNGVLITSAGGVPSISSTLPSAVQGNITTVGTISSGIWQGSIIALAYGGSNANLTASNGGIVWSNATQMQILAGTGTANQVLLSGSSATPAWSTATYPATTTVSQLLYSSSSNVIAGLSTANGGMLITSSSGVPSILQLGAQQSIVGVASNGTPVVASIPGVNMLINSNFQVWQRGAGGSASFSLGASTTTYTADRWQVSTGSGSAWTASQQAATTSGTYYFRLQRNNGNASVTSATLATSLTRAMCAGAAGNVITVSFTGLCGANYSPGASALTVGISSGTGSTDKSGINGAFTGASSILTQNVVLTTSPQVFTLSSSAAGSTVTQLCLQFGVTPAGTAGANDWFEITNVQLEISPNQTAYNNRSFGQELHDCQFFYQKTFPYAIAPAQSAGLTGAFAYVAEVSSTTAGWAGYAPFIRAMFAAPTITYYNPSAANAKWRNATGAADSGTAATNSSVAISEKAVVISNPQVAGDTAGNTIAVHYAVDCDLT